MPTNTKRRAGFTLVEVLIVVAVMGILAGLVLTNIEPSQHEQLMGTANLLVGELSDARTLAVTNDSAYRLTFEPSENRYTLTHAGANSAFDELPDSPFHFGQVDDEARTTDFDELPHLGARVEIVSVVRMTATPVSTEFIEFDGMGGTTTVAQTIIWLGCGSGRERRYASVEVNPVTGLATLGEFQVVAPPVAPFD